MKKQYPGHAKRVMFGVWTFLRQFMYTKFIIVTDDDVDVRDWKEVIWALTTRVDPRARHADRREHADRLSRLRVARSPASARRWASTRPTSGRGKPTAIGAADRDERRGQGARRRDVEAARAVAEHAGERIGRARSVVGSAGAGLAGRSPRRPCATDRFEGIGGE